jgi:hypothetical protein
VRVRTRLAPLARQPHYASKTHRALGTQRAARTLTTSARLHWDGAPHDSYHSNTLARPGRCAGGGAQLWTSSWRWSRRRPATRRRWKMIKFRRRPARERGQPESRGAARRHAPAAARARAERAKLHIRVARVPPRAAARSTCHVATPHARRGHACGCAQDSPCRRALRTTLRGPRAHTAYGSHICHVRAATLGWSVA